MKNKYNICPADPTETKTNRDLKTPPAFRISNDPQSPCVGHSHPFLFFFGHLLGRSLYSKVYPRSSDCIPRK